MALRSQRTTLARRETFEPGWVQIDATHQVLGRLASRIAMILMGKHKPTYTPHVDTGDFVVVTNCERIRVTGNKLDHTTHDTYSGYPGGLRQTSRRKIYDERPELLLELAVKRMLPKSPLGRQMLKKLKAYKGDQHPHHAQRPVVLEN